MRRAEAGIAGVPFGAVRWAGWAGPAQRLRQAASLALVGAILALGGASTRAHALRTLPDEGPPARAGEAVSPIAAWVDFCRRAPGECRIDPAQPEAIPLTAAVWRTLRSVNRRVNVRIKPITDRAHWGVVDRWDFPDDGFGDCEDYQLLKRRMLAERGLPRRALLMTVVIDETDQGHAVLTVRTDRGDFVLDNKTDAIRPWRRTGYGFVKRQGQDGPQDQAGPGWVSLEERGGAAQVAAAEPRDP